MHIRPEEAGGGGQSFAVGQIAVHHVSPSVAHRHRFRDSGTADDNDIALDHGIGRLELCVPILDSVVPIGEVFHGWLRLGVERGHCPPRGIEFGRDQRTRETNVAPLAPRFRADLSKMASASVTHDSSGDERKKRAQKGRCLIAAGPFSEPPPESNISASLTE